MPYEWVPPKKLFERKGVKIYNVYDFDMPTMYWYTTNPNDCDVEEPGSYQFDVRDLPVDGQDVLDTSKHEVIIRAAIEAGIITEEGYSAG